MAGPPLSYRVPILSRFGNNQLIGLFPFLFPRAACGCAAHVAAVVGDAGHRRGRCCDRSLPPQTMTGGMATGGNQPTTNKQK